MRSFGQTSWKRISTATLASASLFGVLASCARDDSSEQSRNSELSSVSQQSADVEKFHSSSGANAGVLRALQSQLNSLRIPANLWAKAKSPYNGKSSLNSLIAS